MNTRIKRSLLVAVVALSLTLAGCASGSINGSSSSPSASSASSAGTTTVSLGVFPSSGVAVFQLGINKGFFLKHGIDLQLTQGASSVAQLPALSTGTLDFLLASPTTPLTGAAKGLDVKIVAGFAQNDPSQIDDSTVIVVGKNSTITRPKSLEGKTVSVNALGGIGQLGVEEIVSKDGGDPSKVKFVQLALNDVPAQIASGQIDAGMTGAPFSDQVVAAGGKILSDYINQIGVGKAELVIAGSGKFISSNPAAVKNFVAALNDTYAYATDHHSEVSDLLPSILGIPAAAAQHTVYEFWSTDVNRPALETFDKLLVKYGVISKPANLDKVIYQAK
ncbi:ABC transporter substrate-binding protein [Lysinimonas soli]|uniref:ABC transporter substrate-binding protein n=1 Tax=Lysinimonas soli TaxID=1074233 RepID=A0ABW0NS21_9MICO